MTKSDLSHVNVLIKRAFTQARIDDGYENTHIPMCRLDFLEMYLSSCPDGCFVMESAGILVAAVFCHVWGQTGWIGPLAVLPEKQLSGYGKILALQSIEFLKRSQCTTIGLETNPRNMRNMGFYAKLGFLPSTLIVDMIRRIPRRQHADFNTEEIVFFSRQNKSGREKFCNEVYRLVQLCGRRTDYSPLIHSLQRFHYGDSIIVYRRSVPTLYASMQFLPTSSEESKTISRVLTLVAHPDAPDLYMKTIIGILERIALNNSFNQIIIRLPVHASRFYKYLIRQGFRIVYSDVRMVLEGYPEVITPRLIHIDRWV